MLKKKKKEMFKHRNNNLLHDAALFGTQPKHLIIDKQTNHRQIDEIIR